jgi:hypothetical protein
LSSVDQLSKVLLLMLLILVLAIENFLMKSALATQTWKETKQDTADAIPMTVDLFLSAFPRFIILLGSGTAKAETNTQGRNQVSRPSAHNIGEASTVTILQSVQTSEWDWDVSPIPKCPSRDGALAPEVVGNLL